MVIHAAKTGREIIRRREVKKIDQEKSSMKERK